MSGDEREQVETNKNKMRLPLPMQNHRDAWATKDIGQYFWSFACRRRPSRMTRELKKTQRNGKLKKMKHGP